MRLRPDDRFTAMYCAASGRDCEYELGLPKIDGGNLPLGIRKIESDVNPTAAEHAAEAAKYDQEAADLQSKADCDELVRLAGLRDAARAAGVRRIKDRVHCRSPSSAGGIAW